MHPPRNLLSFHLLSIMLTTVPKTIAKSKTGVEHEKMAT